MMQVTVCGSGAGAAVNPRRGSSSLHLRAGDCDLLLDCGAGFMERMASARLDPDRVGSVVLSHLHFDHAAGIVELLTRLIVRHGEPVTVYGPRGTDDYVAAAVAFARLNAAQPRILEWLDGVAVELTHGGDEREIGPLRVRTAEVRHASYLECLARRFEAEGRSLVYSGDTIYEPDALGALAEGADLLLHEAYTEAAIGRLADAQGLSDRAREGMYAGIGGTHSTAREAGQIAQAAGVGRLVLTHLLPTEDETELVAEAGAVYEGEVIAAADGMVLEV